MDLRQTGLGIVLFLVFWAFQSGYLSPLGTASWFLAAAVVVLITWAIGMGVMPKPTAEQKELWYLAYALILVIAAVGSFVPPSFLGVATPPSADQFTALLLTLYLIILGGAMFVTGYEMKWGVTLFTGIFWLFAATHLYVLTNVSYIHFGVIVSLPFILYGLLRKD